MDTIAKRLAAFRDSTSLNKKAFADKIGLDSGLYGRYEGGTNKPSFETLEKIAATFPKLSLNWLLTGRGEMLMPGKEGAMAAPAPGLTSGPATVAEAENILLRQMNAAQQEQIGDLKQQVARLWSLSGLMEKLGKMPSNLEAALEMIKQAFGQRAGASEMVLG